MVISCAINFWNSASLHKTASNVPLISPKLSLRLWIADKDISSDILFATENTTAAKMPKTNTIDKIKERPIFFLLSFCFLLTLFFILISLILSPDSFTAFAEIFSINLYFTIYHHYMLKSKKCSEKRRYITPGTWPDSSSLFCHIGRFKGHQPHICRRFIMPHCFP